MAGYKQISLLRYVLKCLGRVYPLYQILALVYSKRIVVDGWSMYSCLAPGEYVLFNRLDYLSAKPNRRDIVVAYGPLDPGRAFIKRVIGLPNESIEITSGRVLVNGQQLEEPYADLDENSKEGYWHLKEGEYLLLGDARSYSNDSRTLGPFHETSIKGKAWLVYWPQPRWRFVSSST